MLDARSVAVVGASARADSFGARMVAEIRRGAADRRIHLVNPRYDAIDGLRCLPSLREVGEPVDLVLLGVADRYLVDELTAAIRIGARSAVVFGSAHGAELRAQLRELAAGAGMALCGPGCMGFANVRSGLRALGYLERDPIPAGAITLITHSGSVFSALLRTRRALGYRLAVSSGQELVTTTADYLEYALSEQVPGVIGLVLETVRDGARLLSVLRRAAELDVPVVTLPLGGSPLGSSMVAAHSGAVAGDGAVWEALSEATGMLRVHDLAELTDTLELLATGRRVRRLVPGGGIATVHDSGAERALTADLADELGVPFANITAPTRDRLTNLLDDGLEPTNPLDVWGTGADTLPLFAGCLRAMVDDPQVAVAALAVDLVAEYDGDTAYPEAVLQVAAGTDKPVVVLANLASAIDERTAGLLRAQGVPVLEGTRSGLVALRNLLALGSADRHRAPAPERLGPVEEVRQRRWRSRLIAVEPLSGAESFALLADYGIGVVDVRPASDEAGVLAAADQVGYPVVLKTDEPGIAHKSDVGGVRLGVADAEHLIAAYRELAVTLGTRVLVSATAPAGIELSIGMVRHPQVGPIIVVGAGGVLMELLSDRAVGCPPLTRDRAAAMVRRLRIAPLLDGWRGARPVDLEPVVDALIGASAMAAELGDLLAALDVNPLIAGPDAAIAVDALVVRHPASPLGMA